MSEGHADAKAITVTSRAGFRFRLSLIDVVWAALAPLVALFLRDALVDLGAPVVFWQKGMGRNGKSFLLYKFRTLHAPFKRRPA